MSKQLTDEQRELMEKCLPEVTCVDANILLNRLTRCKLASGRVAILVDFLAHIVTKATPIIQEDERKRQADKIKADMPTITRYGALQYIRDMHEALKGGS